MRHPVAPDEAVVARLRSHARVLALPAFLLVAVAGASTYVWGIAPERWMSNLFAAVGLLAVIWGSVVPFARWLTVRYLLTSRRLIVRSGVLRRRDTHAPWSRLSAVTVVRSIPQRMLGAGDVVVDFSSSADAQPMRLVVRDVGSPEVVAAAMVELADGSA